MEEFEGSAGACRPLALFLLAHPSRVQCNLAVLRIRALSSN